jgi:tellurite resistance protein TerC
LSIVLVFIGVKMVLVRYLHIPTPLSLGVVVLIIAGSILLSVKATRSEAK